LLDLIYQTKVCSGESKTRVCIDESETKECYVLMIIRLEYV